MLSIYVTKDVRLALSLKRGSTHQLSGGVYGVVRVRGFHKGMKE